MRGCACQNATTCSGRTRSMNGSPSTPLGDGHGNGRGAGGRFGPGNKFSRGNPLAAKLTKQREQFYRELKQDDVTRALQVLREGMNDPDARVRLRAADMLLDRVIGTPVQTDVLERIEELERTVIRTRAIER